MEGWIDEWLLFGTATAGRSCPNHLNDGTPFTMSPYGPGSLLLSGRASRGKEGGPADDMTTTIVSTERRQSQAKQFAGPSVCKCHSSP